MASKHLTSDQQNFTRLVIVCVDLIKLVLKDVLRSKIKPVDLYNAISSCVALTSGRLRPEQQRLCYLPAPNVPNYNTFDASLLYTLIRNLCPRSLKPTLGWGNTPSQTAIQIGDDIERLRIFRNEVHGHCESSTVTDTEFCSRWMDIETAIRRVEALLSSQGLSVNYKKELKKIKNLDLGSEDMDKYKLLLEGMMCLLKKSENEDIPKILIHGENKVTCGEVACFKVDVESSSMAASWSATWQRVRSDTTAQINISTEKYRGSNDRQLVIQRISKADEGGYQAVLSRHNIKVTSNSIFLVPTGDPPVLQTLDVSTGLDGITLHYQYTVTSNSPNVHHITWMKKEEVLCIDHLKYIGGGIDDSYLTITSPTGEDAGQYTCIVDNPVGVASQSLKLDVPSATVSAEVPVYVGSETKINSIVRACPPPEGAAWQKSSDSVTFEIINVDNPKYYGSKRDPSHPDLSFTKATFDDRLYYRLLVWNKIGQCISNTVYLNVTGGPPNISNSHETNIQHHSITLTCEIFLYENSPTLREVCWMKNNEVLDIRGSGGKLVGGSIGDPSLVINNVNEFDVGSYQCKASNAVGSTFGNVIVLDVPDIDVKEHVKDDTKVFTAVLRSIPSPVQVQWSVQNEDTGDWTPIDINSENYKGTTNSLPLPVLIVKRTDQMKPHSFQIDVKNFIGTKTKQIPDKHNLRQKNDNMDDCKGNILRAIMNKKGSTIRLNNLRLHLIKEIPESELEALKGSLKVMTSMEISLGNVTSVEEFIDCLLDRGIFKERNVIMMQYLLRSINRPDLELKCVEYARRNRQALCYYEEKTSKEDGFVQVLLHVVDDIEEFTEMDSLLETLAAVLGCEPSSIKIDAVKEDTSFIIVLLVKVGLANLLLQKDPEELMGLLKFNVDWIKIENNFITIPQKSRDLNIEFRESYDDQISMVLAGPCTSLFRKILRKYVPETDFLAKIEEYKKTLLPALDDTQQLLLYPGRGSFFGSYRDFDLSLLYILLKSICRITAHEQGWGNSPNSTDTSLSSNIDRIMDIHVTHSGDAPPGIPKQSDFDRIMKKVIHISGKIEDILEGSTEAVGTHDRSSTTIQDKKESELQDVLEAFRDVSLSHKTGSSATQISSITVPGVDGVSHICVVTSDRLWVSDEDGRLQQVDSAGHVLHDKLRDKAAPWFTGSHTVTEDGDLLFIDNHDEVCKLTSDGTVTTLLTTYWRALCIHSSRINGDILVGSRGRVTRYDRTGRELQVIEKDDKGQCLYEWPMYITENQNGDILISDSVKSAVVAVDKSGRHRFNYTSRHSPFSPYGICTDVRGHVLVCDYYNNSVHLLDQDGQFLSLLLTQEQHGIHDPTALCVDEQHNLYLGHLNSNTINVYNYLQDADVK